MTALLTRISITAPIEQALAMEHALNTIAMNIDPAKPGAEDVTYYMADALVAIESALAPFRKRRDMLVRLHKPKEGEPPPEPMVEALERLGAELVEITLSAPLGRHELFSVLRVPMPAMMGRLGPMLSPRPVNQL